MYEIMSPKNRVTIAKSVVSTINKIYLTAEKNAFIHMWNNIAKSDNEKFEIIRWSDTSSNVDIEPTVMAMPAVTLLKIAIDLGIETPDFIPLIPEFKNELKDSYKNAYDSFEKAIKELKDNPDLAIGLANSTLESVIKHILNDTKINIPDHKNMTLYQLTTYLLKEFQLHPHAKMPTEIRNIGSSLLTINQSIEKLRSEKTNLHGKMDEDYIIKEAMYAQFVVNAVTTVGLFINSFYKMHYSK